MEDHELIIRIDERVQSLHHKVDTLNLIVHNRLDEQDEKIKALPQWRHFVTAAGMAFLSLGAWVAKVLATGKP
jgi:hypothetical protein